VGLGVEREDGGFVLGGQLGNNVPQLSTGLIAHLGMSHTQGDVHGNEPGLPFPEQIQCSYVSNPRRISKSRHQQKHNEAAQKEQPRMPNPAALLLPLSNPAKEE
jgi:hypothetical protein